MKCENKVLGKFGLTAEQHSVLLAVRYIEDPVTPTEVSRWLDRNRNSVSLIVDRMVKAGLIDRIRDLRDRRSVRLTITDKGKEALDMSMVAGWKLVQEILSQLSEEELRDLITFLEKVREASFEYLNPGKSMEEIQVKDDEKKISRLIKRKAKSGPGSEPAVKE
jgi:DNA-binding MarR family transcriptional regulator